MHLDNLAKYRQRLVLPIAASAAFIVPLKQRSPSDSASATFAKPIVVRKFETSNLKGLHKAAPLTPQSQDKTLENNQVVEDSEIINDYETLVARKAKLDFEFMQQGFAYKDQASIEYTRAVKVQIDKLKNLLTNFCNPGESWEGDLLKLSKQNPLVEKRIIDETFTQRAIDRNKLEAFYALSLIKNYLDAGKITQEDYAIFEKVSLDERTFYYWCNPQAVHVFVTEFLPEIKSAYEQGLINPRSFQGFFKNGSITHLANNFYNSNNPQLSLPRLGDFFQEIKQHVGNSKDIQTVDFFDLNPGDIQDYLYTAHDSGKITTATLMDLLYEFKKHPISRPLSEKQLEIYTRDFGRIVLSRQYRDQLEKQYPNFSDRSLAFNAFVGELIEACSEQDPNQARCLLADLQERFIVPGTVPSKIDSYAELQPVNLTQTSQGTPGQE